MMSLLIVSSLLFIMAIITSKNRTRTRKSALWGAFILFLYMILSAFFVVSDYFTGEGINDAVIFHLAYGLDGSGFGDYYLIIAIGVAFFISSLVFSVVYYRWVKNDIFPMRRTTRYILSCVALIGAFMMHPSVHFIAESVLKVLGIDNPIALRYRFNDYYQTPSLTSIDDEHMNLVYIFAESFENTYYNETIFPSLVTELRALREQGISFTNIKQAPSTGWTIAGMTSVLCGVPLVTPSANEYSPQGNSMSKMSTFYSGAVCLSDILHKEGYKMIYRSGSPLEFAGVDKLYKTHHFEDVQGIKELKPLLKNQQYQTPWGLYDDTLLDIALNDFKKYSKSKQKFAMFISTMDTHHPYGHVSKSCQKQRYQEGKNSMLNAVACSDELITKFIKAIQESPQGNKTIIVVSSDHLAMHNMAIDDLNKGERRNQFVIFDPRHKSGQTIDKVGTTLDIGATILPFLGYQASLGLGRNLMSEEGSLKGSLDYFDKILSAWSKEISRFWEFPKIEADVILDRKKNSIVLGKSTYKFPVLLRINEQLEVNPFFEVKVKFFETPKLSHYIQDFKDEDVFIWVDTCTKIGSLETLPTLSTKPKYCYGVGRLGSEIRVGALLENVTISLETLKQPFDESVDAQKATLRRTHLEKLDTK